VSDGFSETVCDKLDVAFVALQLAVAAEAGTAATTASDALSATVARPAKIFVVFISHLLVHQGA